jgi:hypothetical protein
MGVHLSIQQQENHQNRPQIQSNSDLKAESIESLENEPFQHFHERSDFHLKSIRMNRTLSKSLSLLSQRIIDDDDDENILNTLIQLANESNENKSPVGNVPFNVCPININDSSSQGSAERNHVETDAENPTLSIPISVLSQLLRYKVAWQEQQYEKIFQQQQQQGSVEGVGQNVSVKESSDAIGQTLNDGHDTIPKDICDSIKDTFQTLIQTSQDFQQKKGEHSTMNTSMKLIACYFVGLSSYGSYFTLGR